MQSSLADMKDLLKNYHFYKIQAKNGLGGDCLQKKLAFLENSISVLNEEDNKLIKSIYIDGVPVVKAAKSLYLHRATIYRKIDAIIENLAKVYEIMFLA